MSTLRWNILQSSKRRAVKEQQKSLLHKSSLLSKLKANSTGRSRHPMAIYSVFLTHCLHGRLDWKHLFLLSSVVTRCLYCALCTGVNAWRGCFQSPPRSKSILCCFSGGVMAISESFCLLPQIFLLASGRSSKELEGPIRDNLALLHAVRQDQLYSSCH